jgi:uncharacterized MAPEG superfamily protein
MKPTLAWWILLVAFFLPIVCAGIGKAGRRDYNNADPREWERSLDGYRKSAIAAMNNTFEALPFFAAAIFSAHLMGAPQGRLDLLACVWLALRLLYIGLYVSDRASARSLVWMAAGAVTVWIFVLGV